MTRYETRHGAKPQDRGRPFGVFTRRIFKPVGLCSGGETRDAVACPGIGKLVGRAARLAQSFNHHYYHLTTGVNNASIDTATYAGSIGCVMCQSSPAGPQRYTTVPQASFFGGLARTFP